MPTILELSQGGTGVQSVREIKELLGLGNSAYCEVSQDPNDTSNNKLVTSYVLNEKTKNIASDIERKTVQIERGGTGATSAAGAFKNLVGPDRLPISKGGTGATTAEEALENLLVDALPISKGGTGATSAEEAIRNLGIQQTTIQYPIPIENGGTGATSLEAAKQTLGIQYPVSVANGGTGASTPEEAIRNLGIEYPISVENGGTGATTPEEARSKLGILTVDYPISIGNGGTGATNPQAAREKLGITFPIPVWNGGTGASSLQELKESLGIKYFETNQLHDEDDLDTILKSGVYVRRVVGSINNPEVPDQSEEGISELADEVASPDTPEATPDGPQSPIVVAPSVDPVTGLHYPTADIRQFTMLVISSSNSDNVANVDGVATQILVTVHDGSTNPTPSKIYLRSFNKRVGAPAEEKIWSDWVEVGALTSSTPTTPEPTTPPSEVVTHEWEMTTVESQTEYVLDAAGLPDPTSGIWFVFVGSEKISKAGYAINPTTGSITLTSAPVADQILSVSFVGKS